MNRNPLPVGWKVDVLPGGRVRLTCAAALRRANGDTGCLSALGVVGTAFSGLMLAALPDRVRPGIGPALWVVFAACAAALVYAVVGALLSREEFVAGPGHFEQRRRGPFGGWTSRTARGAGIGLSIGTHLATSRRPHQPSFWMRELYVESAAGGQRIAVVFDTHPFTGIPADDRAGFASDSAARIAEYLAGLTGWSVEDDGAEVVRRQYMGRAGRT